MSNEATFEAQVNAEIRRLFPSLKHLQIAHQETFAFRLGHSVYKKNIEKSWAKGRADIIISYNDKPLFVLELKKPRINLSNDDKEQGISYARAISPMPPIMIISNGTDTQFYKTYDEEPWIPSNFDESAIQQLFNQSLTVASNEIEEAVRYLLGKNDILWSEVLSNHNEDQFQILRGSVGDFTKPLCPFLINREITSNIHKALVNNKNQIILSGAPFSGKTNVLFSLCRNFQGNTLSYLYINMSKSGYGPLQYLANLFNQNYFRAKDSQNVRDWLILALRGINNTKLVLIIDDWTEIDDLKYRDELSELFNLSKKSNFALIFALTDTCFDSLKNRSGRISTSVFGDSEQFAIEPLSVCRQEKWHSIVS
jgi:hypothetical protein